MLRALLLWLAVVASPLPSTHARAGLVLGLRLRDMERESLSDLQRTERKMKQIRKEIEQTQASCDAQITERTNKMMHTDVEMDQGGGAKTSDLEKEQTAPISFPEESPEDKQRLKVNEKRRKELLTRLEELIRLNAEPRIQQPISPFSRKAVKGPWDAILARTDPGVTNGTKALQERIEDSQKELKDKLAKMKEEAENKEEGHKEGLNQLRSDHEQALDKMYSQLSTEQARHKLYLVGGKAQKILDQQAKYKHSAEEWRNKQTRPELQFAGADGEAFWTKAAGKAKEIASSDACKPPTPEIKAEREKAHARSSLLRSIRGGVNSISN